MSSESLEVGCETLVLEVETPVLLEVAVQGPPGPPGADGEDGDPGPPGTTDYNQLTNKPMLGTAAAKDIEFFATATALSTANSSIGGLSTSTSSGLSTATSRIASLSTGLSTGLSTASSSASSGIASLSTSTSSGLTTATSRINSLSTSTVAGLSTSTSGITSLSTSTSSALSTVTVSLAGKVDTTAVGVSVTPLVAGLVPSIYLPSYVDDVLEFASLVSFPATGEAGKIYIALNTSRQYRWGGSAFTELLASPGTTDNVVEGVSNLYFTAARVRSAVLTGLAAGANAVIAASDSVLGAFQKLQAQISALVTTVAGKTDNATVDTLDAQNVKLTGAQNIAGQKSFTVSSHYNQGAAVLLYNTADKVTNFEQGFLTWSSNVLTLGTARGGTGVARDLRLAANVIDLASVAAFTGGTLPFAILGPANAVTSAGPFSRARGNFTAPAGVQVALEVAPTIAQTGTAGFTALDVNATTTTTGNGNLLLQRWAYNGATFGIFRSNGNFSSRGTISAGSPDGLSQGSSFLNALGSFAMAPTVLTSSTTLGITHGAIIVSAAAPMVLTLPAAASCPGRVYPITRTSSFTSGQVTIAASGTELIAGRPTYTMDRAYSSVVLQSSGGTWTILASTEPVSVDRGAPVVNMMSDSGKMTARANPINRTAGVFDQGKMNTFFQPYNGSSAWVEVGKFIFDNSTNGGAAGALTPTVVDLLNAQGRTSSALARYGVEYYVGERTAGAGTTNPAPGYPDNYLTSTNPYALFGADNATTFTGWMRCMDGTQLVVGTQDVWINGVRTTNPSGYAIITPAMGWTHIRVVSRTTIGYDNGWPRIYAETGQKFQVALPGFFLGEVNPGVHLAPLPTINELLP